MEVASQAIATNEIATGRLYGPTTGPVKLIVNRASYGAEGVGARMGYTLATTPLGLILVAATIHGVTWLGIHDSAVYLEAEVRKDYPLADVIRDDARVAPLAACVVAAIIEEAAQLDLPMDIRATPFQLRVWRELCAIPRGATRSYGAIAERIACSAAARAVGHANGSNPTAIIIPCHRVVGASGALTGYRWGIEYKRRLLEREGAFVQPGIFVQRPDLAPSLLSRKGRATTDEGSVPSASGRLRLESRETIEVERSSTKIVVDYTRCESNARCMQVAPEIFQVGDDDQLQVLDEHPPESSRERVLKAIKVCPKQALSLAED